MAENIDKVKYDVNDSEKLNDLTCEQTDTLGNLKKEEKKESNLNLDELTDEYHYLKSGEYTSEIFKVVVHNIPDKISFGRFRETVIKVLGFAPHKTKYHKNQDYAFLALKNEEERQVALEKLNNFKWKNKVLTVKKAAPSGDPLVIERKRKAADASRDSSSKKSKVDEDEISFDERIFHVVCPYWNYTYEEQIKLKEKNITDIIKKLTKSLKNDKNVDCSWLPSKENLCLEILPIIKSPVTSHYRNKVEFTIGKGPDGVDNMVGFRLGSYKAGSLIIVEPTKCANCSCEAIAIAKDFSEFLRTLPYSSFCVSTHVGLWQQLTVRTSSSSDIMAIIQLNPQAICKKEEYDELILKLRKHFTGEFRSVKVTSLYISSSSQKNNNIDTFKLIYGSEHITESLLGLNFRISVDAFFQVNKPAAEILYKTISEWCETSLNDALILDLCCGTGTIGICIAKNKRLPVVGIEICIQAVQDANFNSAANGVTNAKFICGAAEKVLHNEINRINAKNIIAIVDPPRAGLHKDVLKCLRSCAAIKKIIFVSCSPKQAADNLIFLCQKQSKRRAGKPFKTKRAVPIDLFPMTPHCELIVELERVNDTSSINKLQNPTPTNDSKVKSDLGNDKIPAGMNADNAVSVSMELNVLECGVSEEIKTCSIINTVV
uniref:tRNA (uracil(54)-C(5))-methyltransferase n=1 Tax=Hydra vulgaris TaxID=6087 RepID=T2M9Y8_HYDVU